MKNMRLLGGGILGAALAAITVVSAVAAFDRNGSTGGTHGTGGDVAGEQPVVHDMRRDLAKRLGIESNDVSLKSFENVTWPNSCMGVYYPNATCLMALTDGFVAVLATAEGDTYVYHGSQVDFVAVSFLAEREATVDTPVSDNQDEPGRLADPQWAVRRHLADALGVSMDDVSVESFEAVQWPDGCRGVYLHDAMCSMAVVDGWRTRLKAAGSAEEYLYHGQVAPDESSAEDYFTAVWELDPSAFRLGEPLREAA